MARKEEREFEERQKKSKMVTEFEMRKEKAKERLLLTYTQRLSQVQDNHRRGFSLSLSLSLFPSLSLLFYYSSHPLSTLFE